MDLEEDAKLKSELNTKFLKTKLCNGSEESTMELSTIDCQYLNQYINVFVEIIESLCFIIYYLHTIFLNYIDQSKK